MQRRGLARVVWSFLAAAICCIPAIDASAYAEDDVFRNVAYNHAASEVSGAQAQCDKVAGGISATNTRIFNEDKTHQYDPSGYYQAQVYCDSGTGFAGWYWVGNQHIYSTKTPCPTGRVFNPATHQCDVPADHDPVKNVGEESCANVDTHCGNPINVAVGNKYQAVVDFDGVGSLDFSRHYNSHPSARTEHLGWKWTHSYSRSVSYVVSAGVEVATVRRPDGKSVRFQRVSGVWQAGADVFASLQRLTDAGGAPAGWVFAPSDEREQEIFDVRGRLTEILRADGNDLALVYNNGMTSNGPNDYLLTSVVDRQGRTLRLTYDTETLRLKSLATPDGETIEYGYDFLKRLTSVQYPGAAGPLRYHYAEAANSASGDPYVLTGVTREDSARFATYHYDDKGRSVSTHHAGSVNKFTVTYAADGSSSVATPSGKAQARTFATLHGVKKTGELAESCLGCVGRNASRTYDANGYPDVVTDFAGVTTDYDYDTRGLIVQQTDAANDVSGNRRTTQTDWHATLRVPTERRLYGASNTLVARTTWTYNARGQVLTTTSHDPVTSATRTTTTTYCEQADIDVGTCPLLGLVTGIDGPRTDVADVTTFTYYPSDDASCASAPTTCPHRTGDLWKMTDALGHVTETLAYDGAGRVLSGKDASGVVTDYEYHPRGWLTARKVRGSDSSVETDDAITRIEYEPTGLVSKVTDPDGAFTLYEYDQAHRLTAIEDGEGNRIEYTLDDAGNRIQEQTRDSTGVLMRTLARVYDALGQLETVADAGANPIDFTYDAESNVDTVTDALGRVTDHDYDPLRRLRNTLQDVAGIQAATSFEYDSQDRLVSVTDPKGLDTVYTYNAFGDLLQLASPDTGTATYVYDAAGNRVSATDANVKTTTYGYDALNRLTTVTYAASSLDTTYVYDVAPSVCAADETFAAGRLGTMVDGSGSTQYCHDRFGRLVRKVQTTNGVVLEARYAYTLGGRLASVTYPDGAVVDYVRDTLGRVEEVGVTPAGGSRQVLLTQAVHYPFGPPAEWTYGNGRVLKRSLNQNYQPGFIEDTATGGLSLGYEFDAVGNLAKLRTADQADPPLRLFDHDALGRLTDVADGATATPLQGYAYDATGNRTSATDAGSTSAYTYSIDSHRLTGVGGVARTYDAAGNTLTIGGTARVFAYDDANRMAQVTRNGVVAMNYRYNGRGEQIWKRIGSGHTFTVYDEAGRWLGDYDTAGAPLQQAIWLDDLPVGLLAGAGVGQQLHYIESDHLGSPRVVIDPVRDVAIWNWPLTGEAFGDDSPNEDPDGDATDFALDMRFPGQRNDEASGLSYNYFRDYDASSGRYVESDPLGLFTSNSTYAYVEGSPLGYRDPLGLFRCGVGQRVEWEMRRGVPRWSCVSSANPRGSYPYSNPTGDSAFFPSDVNTPKGICQTKCWRNLLVPLDDVVMDAGIRKFLTGSLQTIARISSKAVMLPVEIESLGKCLASCEIAEECQP